MNVRVEPAGAVRATRGRRRLVSLCAAAVLAAAMVPSHAQQATWEGWGKPTAERIAQFLPSPVAGLVDRYPWEAGQGPVKPWMSSGCDDRSCAYFPLTVGREWRPNDPQFVKQVRSLEHTAPAEKLEEIQDRIAALVQQGKYDEAQKLAGSMGNVQADVMASDRSLQERDRDKLAGRLQADEAQASRLKEQRSRRLGLRIAVNVAPSTDANPAGAIQGIALYREPNSYTSAHRQGARLSVYLGSAAFKNPPGEGGARMRGVVKSILVVADSDSTKEHAKADEALALRMLERIDYAGLAKLLQP